MRIESIGEIVHLPVLNRVRISGAAKKAGSDVTVFYVVTVFAVVENRETETVVAQIHPLVTRDLKLGKIPKRISCCRTAVVAELYVVGSAGCVHVNGEIRLEKQVLLLPVNLVVHIYAVDIGIEDEALLNG